MIHQSYSPSLQWYHNGHDGVSNHQPDYCLFNGLFRCRSKKTLKLRVTGLCAGNSPVTSKFPSQMTSNAKNVSIWWHHHDFIKYTDQHIQNRSTKKLDWHKGATWLIHERNTPSTNQVTKPWTHLQNILVWNEYLIQLHVGCMMKTDCTTVADFPEPKFKINHIFLYQEIETLKEQSHWMAMITHDLSRHIGSHNGWLLMCFITNYNTDLPSNIIPFRAIYLVAILIKLLIFSASSTLTWSFHFWHYSHLNLERDELIVIHPSMTMSSHFLLVPEVLESVN